MADDPLTKFTSMVRPRSPASPESQQPPPTPPAVSKDQDGREAYEAFDAKDKAHAHGLDIRCTSRLGALSYLVMYGHLSAVAYDRRTWTRIFMTANALAIEIRGRNLRLIVEAIRIRTCSFIQEYSQDEHILPLPVDPDAPFIESISVEVIGSQTAPARSRDV
jgi:hypothetical protein